MCTRKFSETLSTADQSSRRRNPEEHHHWSCNTSNVFKLPATYDVCARSLLFVNFFFVWTYESVRLPPSPRICGVATCGVRRVWSSQAGYLRVSLALHRTAPPPPNCTLPSGRLAGHGSRTYTTLPQGRRRPTPPTQFTNARTTSLKCHFCTNKPNI